MHTGSDNLSCQYARYCHILKRRQTRENVLIFDFSIRGKEDIEETKKNDSERFAIQTRENGAIFDFIVKMDIISS